MSEGQNSGFKPTDLLGEMQFRDYVDVLRRRKWWVTFAVVPITIIMAIVAYKLPNIYKSETVILVDPQKVPDNYVPSTVSAGISDRLSTIQQEVLSPTRLKAVIDELGLFPELRGKSDPMELVRKMQKSVQIDVVDEGGRRTSAFKITYSGGDPHQVAKVTNRLASMFIEANLKVREQQSVGTAEFIDSELQKTKEQLEVKEKELSEIKARYVMDLPESKQYHLEALTNLRTQLRGIQDRIARDQQEMVLVRSMGGTSAPSVDLDSSAQGSSPVQSQIASLESKLAELRGRYGPQHPDVKRTQAELDKLKAQAEKEPAVQTQTPVRRTVRNPVLEAQLQRLTDDIEAQKKQEAPLQQQIEFHTSKLERVPVFEQRMADLMRDYDTLRTHYTALLDKKLAADMSTALEDRQKGERFVVLDPATVPMQPFGPNRPLLALGGLIGGLFAGIGLATLIEITDSSVRNDREVIRILGKPVLASIPEITTPAQRRWSRTKITIALTGTAVMSVALGFAISFLTRKPL